MNIDIIGMPLNLGANKQGVELAHHTLEQKYGFNQLLPSHQIHNINFIKCPSFVDVKSSDLLMKNRDEIFKANTTLANEIYSSLEKKHFPLIVGGDHALSWGSISGVVRSAGEVGCVYIDAHGDFNPADASPSHNVHGMHMAYLMGLCESPYVDFYQEGIKLNKSNVFFIGTRSLDYKEEELAKTCQLNIQTSVVIKEKGIERVTNDLIRQIKAIGLQKFHLSFDIDVIDPTLAPGTGVPEKEGISIDDAKYILKHLLATGLFISMDFVEFNPQLDEEDKTLHACKDLMLTIDNSLKQIQ